MAGLRNSELRRIYIKRRERFKGEKKLKDVFTNQNINVKLKLGLLRYGFDIKPKPKED